MANRSNVVFVAHDFTTAGGRKRRFRRAIRLALTPHGYKADYADVNIIDNANLKNIISKIKVAQFCIVDITNYARKRRGHVNLNAVFEYGLAAGMKHPAIMVFREGTLNVAREFSDVVLYLYESYRSYPELTRRLRGRIKSMQPALKRKRRGV